MGRRFCLDLKSATHLVIGSVRAARQLPLGTREPVEPAVLPAVNAVARRLIFELADATVGMDLTPMVADNK
jgi:hypothetical protein